MQIVPISADGYNLLHEGTLALSDLESNGIRIDVDYCEKQKERLGRLVKKNMRWLESDDIVKKWKKKYSQQFTFASNDQLSDILFNECGFEPVKYTDKGSPAVDEEALKALGIDLVYKLLRIRKLQKAKDTYIQNLITETQDGYLHPSFNLNTARTYRSCVAKGTEILLASRKFKKEIPIEDVKIGEHVYCYDDACNPVTRKVIWAGKTGHRKVVRIHWRSSERTGHLDVTPEHLVRKTSGDYERADLLLSKDLRSENDNEYTPKHVVLAGRCFGNFRTGIREITDIEYLDETVDVYDLEVEDCHNFIANEICVHNSSSNPNFQNIPTRDPEIGKIVRNAIRARDGHCIIEIDYGGIEVKGAHWYHADPVMAKYLLDPESDMHGDMAQMIFKLDSFDKKVDGEKTLRKGSKNGFVFPQFYGDYYKNNAVSLWNWAGLTGKTVGKNKGVQIKDGVFISENLKNHGIKNYKQFENHLKAVEEDFWVRRFKVNNNWKKRQINWYHKHGYVSCLSGFICQGVMRDNAVTNYPIQSVSFHCLLWALIHVNKKLKRKKMKAKLIGQIHDSIIADVPAEEVDDFIDICKRIMCHKLKNHWDFITTPLEIEIDKTPVGGTWFEKETILEYRN